MMHTLLVSGAFAILVLAVLTGSAGAEQTWYVDDDGPADFASIQAAIDASSDGDTIIVRDGYYNSNQDIDFGGRRIHLRSENGPENCIIDGGGGSGGSGHRVFVFQNYEGEDSIVDGFTITGGARVSGAGIYCYLSSPTIINNKIVGNNSYNGSGGGIACLTGKGPYGAWIIANNTIADNTAKVNGGGILCSGLRSSSPAIINNTITNNVAEGTGGGGGGGIYYFVSSPAIINSIVRGNEAPNGRDILLDYGYTSWRPVDRPQYSNFPPRAGLDGTGNIDVDPLFADPDNGDYHLKSEHGRWDPNANEGDGGWVYDDVTSPCIDAGDPANDYLDEPQPNGDRVNMGAYGSTGEASKSAGQFLAVTTSGNGTGSVELSPPGPVYDEGATVTLTAVASPGSFFDHWEVDLTGSVNPDTIVMDMNKSVVAHFIYPQLTVLSAPIVDVVITGTRAGTTPYTADCDLHEVVALTAPESVSIGGKTYYFAYWSVDNVPVPPSEGLNHLELTMDDARTALAQYDWRLPGDYNDDCTVNILDLLYVRNRLQTRCSE